MAKFVLEIGTEEVPSRFLKGEADELLRLFQETLQQEHLNFGKMRVMATPRRLALEIDDLAERQAETEIIVTGPPLNIAYDEDGKPTKALLGFAAANGASEEDIFPHKTEKGEYIACKIKNGGKMALDALSDICPKIIESLSFPKSMRWGFNTITYARPLRWIMALLDEDVVPFALGPLKSGRQVYGHRVHGPGPYDLDTAANYERMLGGKCSVVADASQRMQMVREGGDALAKAVGGNVRWKDSLLEEVSGLVECPVPLLGDFDPSYLEIPEEVLLTSMETNQKSFGVAGPDGRLLPHFLTVLNIKPANINLVKRGWERVLKARLEDARFFWREDLSTSLDAWLEKLDHVIFIGPLGSMGDKARRLAKLCQWLAESLAPEDLDPAEAARAGLLAKADLVSSMVGEFDTLQGIMGGIYAAKAGESPIVAQAIKEQYLPAGPDTPLPACDAGAILSIADKADALVGCFGLDRVPTGAADPNGLRRCALGIIRILVARNWQMDISRLFAKARVFYGDIKWKLSPEDALKKLNEFLLARQRNYFISLGYETAFVDAVLTADSHNPANVKARLDALVAFGKKDGFTKAVQTLKRVENMGKKARTDTNGSRDKNLIWDKNLVIDAAEKALSAKLEELLPRLDSSLEKGEYDGALAGLEELSKPVDDFFADVLVLCEDEALRQNRLNMLKSIYSRFERIARFSKIQI